MSKKRMMSKAQRLYYESQKKEKIRQALDEWAKQEKESNRIEKYKSYNPHDISYFT
jgi:hypothetical protein